MKEKTGRNEKKKNRVSGRVDNGTPFSLSLSLSSLCAICCAFCYLAGGSVLSQHLLQFLFCRILYPFLFIGVNEENSGN